MNAHALITQPAALPADTYTYEVGTCVSHESQPMPSLIMYRSKTGKGMELYGVRSFAYEDTNRDRLILGASLVVPGEADCKVCLLGATGMCARPELTRQRAS